MKLKLTIITIVIMVLSFFVSVLFFFNSGIIDENGTFDELRTVMIFEELDKIPLINLDVNDWTFHSYGTITDINNGTITIKIGDNLEFFKYDDLNDLSVTDKVRIYYRYTEDNKKELVKLAKILRIQDVKDFNTCKEYGGYIDYNYPRRCRVDHAIFIETNEDLKQRCEEFNGTWNDEYSECEKISQQECYKISGKYDYCKNICDNTEQCLALCCTFG